MDFRHNVLLPRNRNVSQSIGQAKFRVSPQKAGPEGSEDAPFLHYEAPKLRDRINAETERKASFYKARSVFDGSPVRRILPKNVTKNDPKNDPNGSKNDVNAQNLGPSSGPGSGHNKASLPNQKNFAVDRKQHKTQTHKEKTDSEPSRNELLTQYARKQTRLVDLQKQRELLEFEVLELEAQLHQNTNEETFFDSLYAKANTEAHTLKTKVSTLFQTGSDHLQLSKTASSIFSSHSDPKDSFGSLFTVKSPSPAQKSTTTSIFSPGNSSSFRDSAQAMFAPPTNFIPTQDLKKRASAMLNNRFVSEVREKLDQQQNELEEFTKKSTELAKNFISSLSPNKQARRESIFADSSFYVENLGDMSLIDRSVLLSDDDSYGETGVGEILAHSVDYNSDESAIDIDDYDSDEDKENL